jgi:hypothetical protein
LLDLSLDFGVLSTMTMPCNPSQSWQLLQPADVADRGIGSRFDATVIAIDRLMRADLGILEAIGLLGDQDLDIVAQRALDVIGLLVDDFLGDFALTPHRVDARGRALNDQQSSSLGFATISLDFSASLVCREYGELARREGRDHMDRGFRAFLLIRASQRLAINGDHIADAPVCAAPGDEAASEFLDVELRENAAEVIMPKDCDIPDDQLGHLDISDSFLEWGDAKALYNQEGASGISSPGGFWAVSPGGG